MLRTTDNERVFDVDDVPYLIAMADWEALCELARKEPGSLNAVVASTASAKHRAMTGHSLTMGCCASRNLKVVWDTVG